MPRRFMTQTVAQRRELILYGNSLRAMMILSLPTLLMAVVQSMIPLADGLFLNNNASSEVAAAVGFAGPVINTITGFSQGLAIAALSILGQAFGQGDMKKVKHYASQIMYYSFLLGLILAPLCAVAAYLLSKTLSPEVGAPLFRYLCIYSLVLPLLFSAAIYNSIKSATGQPEANFIRAALLLVLKLIFNFVFVYLLKLNEIGAVSASFFSYTCINLWMLYDLYLADSEIKLQIKGMRPDWPFLKSLVVLGVPSIISSVMINFGFFLINLEVEAFGHVVLNAQTIASNITSLAFTLPAAISSTVTAMVSMNIGIQNEKKARSIFYLGCLVSIGLSLLLVLAFLPNTEFLVYLFRKEPEIVEVANRALLIYVWSIIGFGLFSVCNGVFIGLGRTKMTLVGGVLRIWFIRYLFIRLYVKQMGVDAVFWGNFVSNTACGLLFFVLLHFISWKSMLPENLQGKNT